MKLSVISINSKRYTRNIQRLMRFSSEFGDKHRRILRLSLFVRFSEGIKNSIEVGNFDKKNQRSIVCAKK